MLSFARKIMYENDYLGVLVVHIKAKEIRQLLTGNSSGSNRIMADSEGKQILRIGRRSNRTSGLSGSISRVRSRAMCIFRAKQVPATLCWSIPEWITPSGR